MPEIPRRWLADDDSEQAALDAVLDLIEQWQRDGRNGHCLPVIRGGLLEKLEMLTDERRTENCAMCGGNGYLQEYDYKWDCFVCVRPNV